MGPISASPAVSPIEVDPLPWPRPARAWGMVALLFVAGICSIIDRAILNMVVDPVRQSLGIGDAQIGLLQGLAFGLFYAFMGLPMGLLADRISRKRLLMGGILLWSVATIASGLATTFGHLFAARLLVGLGEAALGPSAISLIADLFPADRRGRPISVYMMGQALAAGLAMAFTGRILSAAAAGAFAHWPLLATLPPWRIAFVIAGASGLLVVLAMMTTREPPRRQQGPVLPIPTPGESARWFWSNKAVLAPLYVGFAVCFVAAYGAAAWQPTMLMRSFHITPQIVGARLGPLSMLFSATGPLIGGWLVDRSMKRGQVMSRFTILSIAPLLALPSTLAVLAPTVNWAMVIVASGNAVYAVSGTVMFATLQEIVPPRMRGTSIALTLVLNTLLGATCGPLLVAMVTERVLGDPAAVGWSVALVAAPAVVLGGLLFAIGGRAMRRASAISAS